MTSRDSDYPPSIARVHVYLSLDSTEAAEDTCNQRRLRSDCADAQADLSLRWSHKSYCRVCRALVQMSFSPTVENTVLRGPDTLGRIFAISVKADNCCYFLFAFMYISHLLRKDLV